MEPASVGGARRTATTTRDGGDSRPYFIPTFSFHFTSFSGARTSIYHRRSRRTSSPLPPLFSIDTNDGNFWTTPNRQLCDVRLRQRQSFFPSLFPIAFFNPLRPPYPSPSSPSDIDADGRHDAIMCSPSPSLPSRLLRLALFLFRPQYSAGNERALTISLLSSLSLPPLPPSSSLTPHLTTPPHHHITISFRLLHLQLDHLTTSPTSTTPPRQTCAATSRRFSRPRPTTSRS